MLNSKKIGALLAALALTAAACGSDTTVNEADLVETLQGEGPFTVVAPTNAAFEQALTDLGLPPKNCWRAKTSAAFSPTTSFQERSLRPTQSLPMAPKLQRSTVTPSQLPSWTAT